MTLLDPLANIRSGSKVGQGTDDLKKKAINVEVYSRCGLAARWRLEEGMLELFRSARSPLDTPQGLVKFD